MALDAKSALPKLRSSLTAQRVEQQGQAFLVISDTSGESDAVVYLPLVAAALVDCFDGVTSAEMVLEEFSEEGLDLDSLEHVIKVLTDALFLETPQVRQALQAQYDEFYQSDIRRPAHAGLVYPDNCEELRNYLGQLAAQLPKDSSVNSADNYEQDGVEALAICTPHIDYRRGALNYAASLAMLGKLAEPDVIVLLGTSHQASSSLFQLTKKTFACPLGEIATEAESVERIAAKYGTKRSFVDEYLHRKEHSLELQIPLLMYAKPEADFSLIPVLVSSFHSYVISEREPIEHEEVAALVESISEEVSRLQSAGKKVIFHCGIDLAHMGQAFGDEGRLSQEMLSEIATEDRRLLDIISSGKSQLLFEHIVKDKDKRRICGFPCLYLMLAVFEKLGVELKGKLIDYRQSFEAETDCLVSFASMIWFAKR